MPAYFDSSFLLAGLLGQEGGESFAAFWDAEPVKLSSILIEAECVTAVRRLAVTQTSRPPAEFIAEQESLLEKYLPAVTVMHVNKTVVSRLRQESLLGKCRTLDAIHLATALLFREHADEPITLCTNDSRMSEVGTEFGFPVFA